MGGAMFEGQLGRNSLEQKQSKGHSFEVKSLQPLNGRQSMQGYNDQIPADNPGYIQMVDMPTP